MTRTWRWVVVAAVVALLVGLPSLVRAFPVGPGSIDSAAALLDRIRASRTHPYAGSAESTGSLALPITDQLSDVASLLGGRTQLRAWWRSADDWRSDTVTPAGERSTRTSSTEVQVWDFEDSDVAVTGPDVTGAVRLPRVGDTLPPELAARLLSGATAAQVSTLSPRRVAGRAADGLRMTPDDPLSSIARVDVWADQASGIPVLVEVFGRTGATAALSSTFLDFTDTEPSVHEVAFSPPPGSRVFTRQRFDLVRAIGQIPDTNLPARLLGFDRTPSQPGLEGIGQYGRGVTQVAVGAIPERAARSLLEQLRHSSTAVKLPEGVAISVGPVSLLVTDPQVTGQTWLVAGTLTPQGLAQAATQLRPSPGAPS